MQKIALTGTIGSGKSTVAKYFAALGATVIDADVIAHELTKPNTLIAKKIIAHFGHIDRKALRKIIFGKPKERQWLENLLHPLIYKRMLAAIKKVKTPYCILVLPLLLETKYKQFRNLPDRILFVDAAKKIKISRIIERDKISKKDAEKIFAVQAKRKTSIKIATDIIENNATRKELRKKVLSLHKNYLL